MLRTRTKVYGIVAIGPHNIIGIDGAMPWHSRSDLNHFRKTTLGWPCVFGKTTYENMPKKPLDGRFNIVCSSQYNNQYLNGAFRADSLESAISTAGNFERVFICGGAQIYKYALDKDLLDVMYVTLIKNDALAKDFIKASNLYTQFPIDSSEFFDTYKWHTQEILYKARNVSSEQFRPLFFKCTRLR